MRDTHAIGTKFIRTSDKQKLVNEVIDILTTTNLAWEVVQVKYLCVHVFCGQPVTSLECDVTIARGKI